MINQHGPYKVSPGVSNFLLYSPFSFLSTNHFILHCLMQSESESRLIEVNSCNPWTVAVSDSQTRMLGGWPFFSEVLQPGLGLGLHTKQFNFTNGPIAAGGFFTSWSHKEKLLAYYLIYCANLASGNVHIFNSHYFSEFCVFQIHPCCHLHKTGHCY